MNSLFRPMLVSAVIVLLGSAAVTHGQLPSDPEEKAKFLAQLFEMNAREITVFDRHGNVVSVMGSRGLYQQPAWSPDNRRVAVVRHDLAAETSDIVVVDVDTGASTTITASKSRQPAQAPVWSPDGRWIAYVAWRGDTYGIYRSRTDMPGQEELLYRHLGGTIVLTDWSLDSQLLAFYASDLSGSILYALRLTDSPTAIELVRSKSQILGPRFSPDCRFVAYRSNETGKNEIFVRALTQGDSSQQVGPRQVSDRGGLGLVQWRRDGNALYYLDPNRGIISIDIVTAPSIQLGEPKLMFAVPDAFPVTGTPGGLGNPAALGDISRDGERIVLTMPPLPQLRQLTMFDRQGRVASRIGEPGLYNQPSLSPDGTRLAVIRTDRVTGQVDVWSIDVATGKTTPVTNDTNVENAPIWSPDGRRVLYVSTRGSYSAIYRKAAEGSGAEEMLFRYTPGAGFALTDVSADGTFVTFSAGGVVFVVALTGSDPLARKAIEFTREEFDLFMGRFSPDGQFMAYVSNESQQNEIYVRPFDKSSGMAAGAERYQVTREGADGMVFWRSDGRELYFIKTDLKAGDNHVMATAISRSPSFHAETPKVLFTLKGFLPGNPRQWRNISPDGQRFVFALPVAAAGKP